MLAALLPVFAQVDASLEAKDRALTHLEQELEAQTAATNAKDVGTTLSHMNAHSHKLHKEITNLHVEIGVRCLLQLYVHSHVIWNMARLGRRIALYAGSRCVWRAGVVGLICWAPHGTVCVRGRVACGSISAVDKTQPTSRRRVMLEAREDLESLEPFSLPVAGGQPEAVPARPVPIAGRSLPAGHGPSMSS